MQARTAYTERNNQEVGIVSRNLCAAYRVEVPKSHWCLRSCGTLDSRQLLTNQADTVVTD